MKDTRILMGMPITVSIIDPMVKRSIVNEIFDYFHYIDTKFSTYKKESEISKINRGELNPEKYSKDMKEVLLKCEETKRLTQGFFNIMHNAKLDPSGLVKGWSIKNASLILLKKGFRNFYIDAGGDIQVSGTNARRQKWRVGIRNPFDRSENVKILSLTDKGIATSGTAIRGEHIYDPHGIGNTKSPITSLTVIGPDVYEADRFATAAFAMGEKGIHFIGSLRGFEGYMIDNKGTATFTEGFDKYTLRS